ncbi:MAG: leucyl aminopeptidase [Planctomycetes bacterium]|nr:leucyl aminopeptidase [Planctomycetota bacterium]
MKVNVKFGTAEKETSEITLLGIFEGAEKLTSIVASFDTALGGIISDILKRRDFKGKQNETLVFPTYGKIPTRRVMLVGLGKRELKARSGDVLLTNPALFLDKIRQASGVSAKRVQDMGLKSLISTLHEFDSYNRDVSVQSCAEAVVTGSILGAYQFTKYKTSEPEEIKKVENLTLIVSKKALLPQVQSGARSAEIISEAVCFVRDLGNMPACDTTPTFLANTAKQIAKESKLRCEILSKPQMKSLGMGGLLGTSQGSTQPPKFIIIEYNARDGRGGKANPIVLVGKGITFDSGGISIKPAKDMEKMKYDMAGAAAVLGTIKAIAVLKIPLDVVGLIPCTENLPSGGALKPGDVLRSITGKTIEIISTDAEGRVILADALGYAKRYKPQCVIDMATLTGACVVALGTVATGMFGNNEELKERVKKAGEASFERVWELPLWEEYDEQIKSDIADIKNVGGSWGGAITGACFLKKFVEDFPWVHLDIAGTAMAEKDSPYTPKGGTGVGVRLMVQLLRDWTPLPTRK